MWFNDSRLEWQYIPVLRSSPVPPSCYVLLSFPFKSTNAVVVVLNKHHMTNDVDLFKVT